MLPQAPLHQLAVFAAAARRVSFTAAAAELGVTQSAVSQQVRLLEERLGRPLFRRLPRGLMLTDEGRALLPLVEEALARLSEGVADLFGRPGEQRVVLRGTVGFQRFWLLPRLPAFRRAHPGLRLRLVTANWAEPQPPAGIDLEVRLGLGDWPGLTAERLTRDRLLPVAAPALAAGLRTPADLAGQTLIHSIGFREGWPAWLAAAGQAGLASAALLEVDTAVTALALAESGEGVALGRSSFLEEGLAAGRLVAPFTLSLPSAEGFWLLRPAGRRLSPAAQVLADWLVREAGA